MVLREETLEEILSHLDKSINSLASDAFGSLETEGEGYTGIENFLQDQFEIRLENMLATKNSSIHHLESAMKNKIIQRKQIILDEIFRQYKN